MGQPPTDRLIGFRQGMAPQVGLELTVKCSFNDMQRSG